MWKCRLINDLDSFNLAFIVRKYMRIVILYRSWPFCWIGTLLIESYNNKYFSSHMAWTSKDFAVSVFGSFSSLSYIMISEDSQQCVTYAVYDPNWLHITPFWWMVMYSIIILINLASYQGVIFSCVFLWKRMNEQPPLQRHILYIFSLNTIILGRRTWWQLKMQMMEEMFSSLWNVF